MIYTIPAMSLNGTFNSLPWVATYVEKLIESTGDIDYSIVLEWDDLGPGDGRVPKRVLIRLDGEWHAKKTERQPPQRPASYARNRYGERPKR